MFVLVVVRQHEEQLAGGQCFLLWGLCVLAAIWVPTVFVAYPSAVRFLTSKLRWLHLIVRIIAQGNDVCVGGCKTT